MKSQRPVAVPLDQSSRALPSLRCEPRRLKVTRLSPMRSGIDPPSYSGFVAPSTESSLSKSVRTVNWSFSLAGVSVYLLTSSFWQMGESASSPLHEKYSDQSRLAE